VSVDELRQEFALTLAEIEQLEAALNDQPKIESAIQLNAQYEVAKRLKTKIEEAEEVERQLEAEAQQRAQRVEYETLVEQLDMTYAEGAEALRVAVDKIERAFDLKNQVRRSWALLDKQGVRPDNMPDSFWPRYPKLRNDFIESVLRNGEP